MKKSLLVAFLICYFVSPTVSQSTNNCSITNTNKLLLIGDSWAHFMLIYRGYSKSFEQHGFPDITEVGNNTVIMGAQAETWSEGPGPRLIKKALRENKDLTMVAITLGGNDVMWDYEAPEPYEMLEPEATRFMLELDTIIDIIEEERPELEILIVGYDYPNMVEPLLDNPYNPYWDTYISMNYPTPEQLNLGLQYFEKFRMEWPRIKNDPKVHFLYDCGLMQYTFGQEKPVPVYPYDPYPAFSVPFPNGDPRYPTPQVAMGLNGFDTYHLGPEGFKVLADHHLHTFMLDNLRDYPNKVCNATMEEESGNINENGYVKKGQISAGRNNNKDDVKAIISIATDDIPDNAVITSASLFITRQAQTGDRIFEGLNPSNAIIDIKNGFFGINALLAKEDYDAIADGYDIACMVGNAPQKNYTLRFDILPEYFDRINVIGTTQFRLAITPEGNKSAEMLFYNTEYPRDSSYFLPHLDVKYTLSTPTKNNIVNTYYLYPNPAKDVLYLRNNTYPLEDGTAYIIDSRGSIVYRQSTYEGQNMLSMNISNLPSGKYIVQMNSKEGIHNMTFVK